MGAAQPGRAHPDRDKAGTTRPKEHEVQTETTELMAARERIVELQYELSQVHEDNARLTGRVAWFYRNSTRMTQMRYDAATAAGYDFTQYAATMEQPADRDALLAYLREEITLAEREIVLIEGTVEQKAALHIGDGWNCVVCGESYPCPTATAGFEADLADLGETQPPPTH